MEMLGFGRTMMMAGVVAASVLGSSAMGVQAQFPWHNTKAACEADGYRWDPVKGCADQYCIDGLMGYGDPGETQVFQGRVYMCDGFTGQWGPYGMSAISTWDLPIVAPVNVGVLSTAQPIPTPAPLTRPIR